MSGKDLGKLGAAVAIIGVAVGLFVYQSRSRAVGEDGGDDEASQWYCTKTQKFYELRGEESDGRVKMAPRPTSPPKEGAAAPGASSSALFTISKSPYTDDWTGVPAMKCGQCGEMFVLNTAIGESACPKCQWKPGS